MELGKKIEVNKQGWIMLTAIMGSDRQIAQCARTSYGKDGEEYNAERDRKLIRYMMRHGHTSPFEQAELQFLIYVPMDCWRQWVRHRTASINEYSTRYSVAIDEMHEAETWRKQSESNNQGSEGEIEPALAQTLSKAEKAFHEAARNLYNARIEAGVAREQARKDLPLSTYTRAYWKIDLHNLLHFLKLRLDSHAQLEIRQYAEKIAEVVKEAFPITWEAFEDCELNAVKITATEQKLWPFFLCRQVLESFSNNEDLKKILKPDNLIQDIDARIDGIVPPDWKKKKCRERDEFFEKFYKVSPDLTFCTYDKEESWE